MSKEAAKLAAIHAPKIYAEIGQGRSPRPSAVREILTGLTLGLSLGLVWKTWHWGEKKKINKYYEDLAAIYAKEDSELES